MDERLVSTLRSNDSLHLRPVGIVICRQGNENRIKPVSVGVGLELRVLDAYTNIWDRTTVRIIRIAEYEGRPDPDLRDGCAQVRRPLLIEEKDRLLRVLQASDVLAPGSALEALRGNRHFVSVGRHLKPQVSKSSVTAEKVFAPFSVTFAFIP